MTTIEPQPAASANYMALILSEEGDIVANFKELRTRVIHLEPTLSYAIAWAGYEKTHASLVESLRDALQRLQAREQAILFAPELNAREVWQLKDDVERFGKLLEAAVGAQNDLKKNERQFDMDVHMSVVELVKVRWELEECEF